MDHTEADEVYCYDAAINAWNEASPLSTDLDRIMGHGTKAARTVRKKDQLIELPDGILSTIISMLPLKEALRTSVLSKQWRFIWNNHSGLWFDSDNVLGRVVSSSSISELEIKTETCKFIERVNHFMHQRCKGTKVDSFALHFCLGKDSAPHLYQWISSAIRMGVENIDLDLSASCIFMVDHSSSTASEEYEFPTQLLAAAGKKCCVKHLQLTSCSLISPPDSYSLTSLVTIQLENVNVSDEQLESFLSSCLFLEGLSLHLCNHLVELDFVAPSLRLKRLSVHDCFRLQKMELRAKNLVLFEYTGHLIFFYFKDVPRLAEAFLNFTVDSRLDGAAYALTKFVSDVPQLETLNLVSVLAMKMLELPETVPTFTNIRELALTIFPFDDEDKLCWSNYVLKNFPLLHKLQLNLFCANFIKQPKEIERVLRNCPHYHLSELEINGFYGNHHEQVLLKYLLDNLAELKVLAVSPCQKVYSGFNSWVYEEANSWYKDRMESVCDWLDAVVPPTVRLEIR